MTVSTWQIQDNPEKRIFDLILIGAGIAGLSAAYWYRCKFPTASVLILEKNTVGFGASGKNAGFVTCGSVGHFQKLIDLWGLDQAMETWRFSEQNHLLLRQHLDLESGDFDYTKNGSLSLATTEKSWNAMKATFQIMKGRGLPVEEHSSSSLTSKLGLKKFGGGVLYQNDGQIHPLKLLTALVAKAKTEIRTQTEVYGITPGQTVRIETNKGTYVAKQVLLATNGFANLLPHPSLPKILPQRNQVLVTDPVDFTLAASCYSRDELCYFRQLPNKSLLIGGFRHLDREAENTYEDRLNPKLQSALESFLYEHLEIPAPVGIRHRWSGLMGYSEDEKPKLLEVEEGLFFMGGFSGHGMGIAFHLGQHAVAFMEGLPLPRFLL